MGSFSQETSPRWQGNYFTGMPAPAGAITVLLPLYIEGAGLFDARQMPVLIAIYTLAMAFLLVSTIPTFSGKSLGDKIRRELVLPILVAVASLVALVVTYPYGTMLVLTIAYLATIPFSIRQHAKQTNEDERTRAIADAAAVVADAPNVVDIRSSDPGQR